MSKKVCFDIDEMQRLMDACNLALGSHNVDKHDYTLDEEERREASVEVMKYSILRSKLQRMKNVCGTRDAGY